METPLNCRNYFKRTPSYWREIHKPCTLIETALHIAAMGGQTEFVRELLKLKPDFATRQNKDGFSAIHIASANGFVETVRE
jgi:ankyrin repeat protein